MHRHPTQGIKAAKPRLPGSNGETSKAEISRLSREYLEIRNTQLRAKAFLAEMAAAVRRGELIEERLVTAQAQYLFVAMRRKILNLPQTYSRRLVGYREIAQVLHEAAHSILNEIRDLPGKVADPRWLESLDEKAEESKTRR